MTDWFIEKLTYLFRKGLIEQEQTEENLIALNYGISVIFLNLPKTITLLFIAKKLKIIKPVMLAMSFYGLIRNFSLGIHAKTSIRCFVVGMMNYLGIAYISHAISIPKKLYNLLYAYCFCIYMLYAPAGTDLNPIDKNQYKPFKLISLVIIFVYYWIGRISSKLIRNIATLAVISQSFSIIPLIYKLQKRGDIHG